MGRSAAGAPGAASPAIEAAGLALGYGGRRVLDGVTLTIPRGAGAVALVGANGSGKSTFLRACLGLASPMAGRIGVLGTDSRSRGFRGALKRVGWVPQQRPTGALRLTVREFVYLGRHAASGFGLFFGAADREAVDGAMETAGIANLAGAQVQELSGGQFQRASIARALAGAPELLLLDEPTTHLDRESRALVLGVIGSIRCAGKTTIVVVSHDPAVLGLCDSRFAFARGRVEPAGREAELG